ncbi:hypothetical protein TPAR_06853 [Tolypocladium paradoxum]|uniref:Uncharacterized protein n=1 Tax=Tolypocladium paradoxum TaxID=94208 RepID=A0A2S4KRY9_9HYPO|nr:hypothetical protein TPAR_06853 [Tolypocladium paradoxum]
MARPSNAVGDLEVGGLQRVSGRIDAMGHLQRHVGTRTKYWTEYRVMQHILLSDTRLLPPPFPHATTSHLQQCTITAPDLLFPSPSRPQACLAPQPSSSSSSSDFDFVCLSASARQSRLPALFSSGNGPRLSLPPAVTERGAQSPPLTQSRPAILRSRDEPATTTTKTPDDENSRRRGNSSLNDERLASLNLPTDRETTGQPLPPAR